MANGAEILTNGARVLTIDHEKCTGCRLCELVCAVKHDHLSSPVRSRIRVIKWEAEGLYIPMSCQQCEDAPCLEVCPQDALSRDATTDAVVLDAELCIQCGSCVSACVVGLDTISPEDKLAIRLDSDTQLPLKCNLCMGDSQCVKFCPTEALRLTDEPVAGEFDVTKMMQALELFLKQEELPLTPKERKSDV